VTRVLVAGFGNVLRGDDGFGVEVVQRLQRTSALPAGVEVVEIGIAGIRLVQELLTGYDRLIVVDAVQRGAAPGTLHVLAVDGVDGDPLIDPHAATPERAIAMARAARVLPPEVFLVGCEPAAVDSLEAPLSAPVAAMLDAAIDSIQSLVTQPFAGVQTHGRRPS